MGQPKRADVGAAATLTVGEVATGSGIAPSAVRFYERYGVIHAARDSGNHRRFDDHAICRIAVAKLAQGVGLTVREIAELFEGLPSEPSAAHWQMVGDHLVAEAERRVADLKKHLDDLGSGVQLCSLPGASA